MMGDDDSINPYADGKGAQTNLPSPSTMSWDGFTSSGTGADTSSGEILNHVSVDRAEKPLLMVLISLETF